MAEYRLEFEADASRASRTISLLEKVIKGVTKEFKDAEIGSEEFLKQASQISRLTKELVEAKSAVVNIERAQKQFNQALESGNRAFGGAVQAAQRYNDSLQKIANEGYQEQAKLRNKNYQDELDDWDRRLQAAVAASSKIARQQQAIMEFRAGMGARGAIPAIASPIRGGAAFPGSPEYNAMLERNMRAAAGGAAQVVPAPKAFDPKSLAAFEAKLKTLKAEARLIAPGMDRWKELTREIIKTEKQVRTLQKAMTGGPSASARLGAAGGAFLYGGGLGGGVGSALGGVAGGLLGGVSGAFTGAALGQFTDNIGNALAATAKFTAEIDKQRIALRNVIGDTEQYNQALAFITKTSKELAIPQEILNQSFTQISASVIGAGGSVRDAEEAFLGIAAGIRGTGGSLADMEGALRATAQVFSKGKVSAEELRQQIGERLPGAFTLFAKSIGKTPQELDKMLEQGQVGLNDFMVFVRQLSATYGSTAQEIAASTQAAGDRMAVAMSTMREAVGRELQPVGAEFQAVFGDFIQNQSPNFISAAKALAESLKPLAAALGAAAENAEALTAGIGAFAAVIIAAKIPAAFSAITASIAGFVTVSTVAAAPLIGVAAAIAVVTAAHVEYQKEVQEYRRLLNGPLESLDELASAIKETEAELSAAQEKSRSAGTSMSLLGEDAQGASMQVQALRDKLNALQGRYKAIIEIEQIFTGQKGVPSGYKKIDGRLAYEVPGQGFVDAETGKVIKQQTSGFKPTAPTGGGGGGRRAKGGRGRESRLPELTEELNLAKQIFSIDQQIAQAQLADNQLAVLRLNGDKEQLRIASEISRIKLQKDIPAAEQLKQIEILRLQSETKRLETNVALQQQIQQELKTVEQAMVNIATTAAAELEDRKSYERLVAEGLAPAMAQITIEVQRQFAVQVAQLESLKKRIEAEIGLLEIERDGTANAERRLKIEEEIAKRKGQLKPVQEAIEGAPGLAQATIESRTQKQLLEERPKSSTELITEASKNAQNELAKLTNFGYQAVEGAKAIGGAFAQAFKDIASGSMTAQEALASMMQSIASHFLDMAAQIIAQQMTMIILGGIMRALGIGGGLVSANTGGFAGMTVPNNALGEAMTFQMMSFAADGAYWQGGFQAFADGGVVNGPTLGLVGEGGEPEYIIPASKMSGAMARYNAGARGNAVIPAEGGEGISSMSIGAPLGAIDVRYSVERINSVDYVTADQFQRGMAQAAQQGAKQGEQMTLRRLQQSRSTRSRLGMS